MAKLPNLPIMDSEAAVDPESRPDNRPTIRGREQQAPVGGKNDQTPSGYAKIGEHTLKKTSDDGSKTIELRVKTV